MTSEGKTSSRTSLRSLDWLNFTLADVCTDVGLFFSIYLVSVFH